MAERLRRGVARLIRSVGYAEARAFLEKHHFRLEEDEMEKDHNDADLLADAEGDARRDVRKEQKTDAMAELDRRIAEQAQRLEERPDPEPEPPLPPLERKTIMDIRFVVEHITERDEKGKKLGEHREWHCYGPSTLDDKGEHVPGPELDHGNIVAIACASTELITQSKGWPQNVFLAARGFQNTVRNARSDRPSREEKVANSEARAKAEGGGTA